MHCTGYESCWRNIPFIFRPNIFISISEFSKVIQWRKLSEMATQESQNGSGWKWPLKVTWSSLLAQARSCRDNCPGPRLSNFWISPRMETSLPLWQPMPVTGHSHDKKGFSSMIRWKFMCFNLCPLPLLLSLGVTEKSLFHSLPSGIYTHW